MEGFRPHPTPNPDSLKVMTTGRPFIESGMETFGSPSEAARHPLARALFMVDGVVNVFILPEFLTVTKAHGASWDDVWPAVARELERHAGR